MPAFLVSLVFLVGISVAMVFTIRNVPNPPNDANITINTGNNLAIALFGKSNYALPIEIGGLLLLAALIGAIVILREKDK